jgi:c-di-GMP-binding flagellar brake protein YcgR
MSENIKIVNLNQTVEIILNEIRYTFEIMLIKEDCVIISLSNDGVKNNVKLRRWDELDMLIGGKTKGVVYRCKSAVLGKIEYNGETLFVIKHPVPVSSVNRREHYRHTLSIPVEAYLFIDDQRDICFIDNISAGGLRIIYKRRIEKDNIGIEFLLEGGDKIKANCQIVKKGYKEKRPTHFYSLKFEDINKKDQEKIIAFIFRKIASLGKKAKE